MPDDLTLLADESAREAQAFLVTMTEVASGEVPDAALPMTLLAVSQLMLMGARLGAIQDVVSRFLRRYSAGHPCFVPISSIQSPL